MIERHHEHSFDLDLMPRGSWALDVGCRGFAIPFMLADAGVNVLAVDPDPEVNLPPPPSQALPAIAQIGKVLFCRKAVVHRELAANKKITLWKHRNDKQAHSIVSGPTGRDGVEVNTLSIPGSMERIPGPAGQVFMRFSLIKLDCEGAEYRLMHDLADAAADPESPRRFWATQISVEYHDHCGLNPQPDMEAWYSRLHARLAPYYDVARHVRERPPWGGQPHYIDSLYILRPEFRLPKVDP